MIGRNHHKMLSWEKRRIVERSYQIQAMSDVLYNIEEDIGYERLKKVSYTWGSGITFTNLNKEEFKVVKSLLPSMSKLDKVSNEYGLTLKGRFAETTIKDWNIHLTVDFKWALPDTCVLEYKDVIKDVNPDHYFVAKDGKVMHKTKETIVNCDKPMLEAVFSAQLSGMGPHTLRTGGIS